VANRQSEKQELHYKARHHLWFARPEKSRQKTTNVTVSFFEGWISDCGHRIRYFLIFKVLKVLADIRYAILREIQEKSVFLKNNEMYVRINEKNAKLLKIAEPMSAKPYRRLAPNRSRYWKYKESD